MKKNEDPIDFVITWVDGSDPAWRAEKADYMPDKGTDAREERYRDWNLLRYWFRGVEKFAPWVRKIHFVTWGHLPSWLDTNNPKLHIVRHDTFIPKEFLPVFNSNVIEFYLHKIEGLAENFVYFNDDMFLLRPIQPKVFFRRGKPCDMLAFQPVVANPMDPVMSHLYLNNALVLTKHFRKRDNVKKQVRNYFKLGYPPLYFCYNILEMAFPLYTGFYTIHGAMPFCKQTFLEIWEKEEEVLTEASKHRFRHKDDVTIYLFREWQKLSGNFYAKNAQRGFRYFNVDNYNLKLLRTIRKQKAKMICMNDANYFIDFDRVKGEIEQAFSDILPEVSSFEHV